jgi:hypothetical protein
MTRYLLTADHVFNIKGAGPIVLEAGSCVGDGGTDYPIANILNFAATTGMVGLDGAGITAVSAHAGGVWVADGPQAANAPAGSYAKHPTARGSNTWNTRP